MRRWHIPWTRVKSKKPIDVYPSSQGLAYEEVSFYSRKCRDVVLLRGWYIPSKNGKKCIIIMHGFHSNRTQTEAKLLEMIKALVNHGYNVLTFDLRAHGESGGEHIELGYYEVYDALGAFDFVVNKKNIRPQNIGVLGFSYGAMVGILTAKRERIAALVADGCPGDTRELVRKQMLRLHIPLFLFYLCSSIVRLIFGVNVNVLDTKKAVKKIPTPIFFIHGTNNHIPISEVRKLYQAKSPNSLDRMWGTEGVGHIASYRTFPEEYIKNIVDFFNKAL